MSMVDPIRTDPTLKKMVHGFFGLSETVNIQHKGISFAIRFSRPTLAPDARIDAVVDGSDLVTTARLEADPVWTVVAHGTHVMFFRTSYSQRLARAEIILMADQAWRFSWKTHTDQGVPDRSIRR